MTFALLILPILLLKNLFILCWSVAHEQRCHSCRWPVKELSHHTHVSILPHIHATFIFIIRMEKEEPGRRLRRTSWLRNLKNPSRRQGFLKGQMMLKTKQNPRQGHRNEHHIWQKGSNFRSKDEHFDGASEWGRTMDRTWKKCCSEVGQRNVVADGDTGSRKDVLVGELY